LGLSSTEKEVITCEVLHEIQHLIEYQEERVMDEILTELVTPISEFKKNPNLSVKAAKGKPFAVLTNNKPSFYVLTPELYDELLEKVWELKMMPELLDQIAETEGQMKGVRVNLDDYL
jgi:antitoxin StbD